MLMIEEGNESKEAMPVSNMLGIARDPAVEFSTLPDARGFTSQTEPSLSQTQIASEDNGTPSSPIAYPNAENILSCSSG